MGFNTRFLKKDNVGVSPATFDFLSHWRLDIPSQRVVSDLPIETTLDSMFLGDHVQLSSSGSGVYFTNALTGISWTFPARGIKDQSVLANQDSTGVIREGIRVYEDFEVLEVNGAVDNATTVDAVASSTTVSSRSFFGIEIVVAESIVPTDRIEYKIFFGVDNTGIQVYAQVLTGLTLAPDDILKWNFKHPLDIDVSATTVFIEIIKNKTSLLQVRAGLVDPTELYRKLDTRAFSIETLATVNDLHDPDKIISPDGLKNLTITDTTLKYHNGTRNIIKTESSGTKIVTINSDDNYMKVLDTSIGFVWGGTNALHITNTAAKLTSKNGNNYIQLKNASTRLQQDGKQKLWMDNTNTILSGNSGESGAKLVIGSTDTLINDGTWNRLGITSVTTVLVSADGFNTIILDNFGHRLAYGAQDRIDISATVTSLISPNNLESITVDDLGAFYNTKKILTESSGVKQPVSRSSTDNGVARFDGTDGSTIQSSLVKITDNDILEFDNSRFITTNITTGQNEDNMVGTLSADLWVVVPAEVTRFTVRDLDNNIGTFIVRIIFIDGTDELTLTRGHDYVEVYKINSVWYFYNTRTGLGGRVST